jgi:hypothetical protein
MDNMITAYSIEIPAVSSRMKSGTRLALYQFDIKYPLSANNLIQLDTTRITSRQA